MRFEFQEVMDFWFGEMSDSYRWSKGKLLDPIVKTRFGAFQAAAAIGELWEWRASPEGR